MTNYAGYCMELLSKIAYTVAISVRNTDLFSYERQGKLLQPTFISGDIAEKAIEFFTANYHWDKPIRSLGVRGADLVTADDLIQLDMFGLKKIWNRLNTQLTTYETGLELIVFSVVPC